MLFVLSLYYEQLNMLLLMYFNFVFSGRILGT